MNKLNNWLLKNKDVISLYITALIGVASIVVGCVSISVMRGQIKMQDQDDQPIFRIETEYYIPKGSSSYDTEYLHIYNDGEPVIHYNYVRHATILHIQITESVNNTIEDDVLIANFYDTTFNTNNLTGKISTSFKENNNANYYNLHLETINKTRGDNYYFISRFNLIEISYLDKHNNTQVVYYADNRKIDKKHYDIFPHKVNNQRKFCDINTVTLDDIIEIVKSGNSE
ncbi:MAG: hypothetical protein SNH27_11010 [Rikenellaceae bacterium]